MEQEVNQNPADSVTDASGGVEGVSVPHTTYRKTVVAEQNAKKRAAELELKLQEFERRDMEAKGEFEKLKQSLLQENETLRQTIKKKDSAFFDAMIKSSVKTEAVKAGCSNPDKLIRLLNQEDFELLRADEDGYSLKQDSLQSLIDKAKKENDFLFTKPEVRVNDLPPKGKVDKPKSKGVNEMTKEELEQAILALNKNRR